MTTEERSHAELGGSSASRWLKCPGSIFLYRDLGPQEESEAAKLGTEVHNLCEEVVRRFLTERETGEPFSVPEGDAEALLLADGYKDTIWENVLQKSITGKAWDVETKLTLSEKLAMSGYVDFWCIYIDDHGKKVACIVDYKNGYHQVEAKNNAQLAFYACALVATLREHGKSIDYVRAAIYQPNAGKEHPYEETKFTAKQLAKWEENFLKAAETIYVDQKPKFKVGEWCKYCRAQVKCDKYTSHVSKKTALKLAKPAEITLPKPEVVPDETIVNLILHADIIETYLSECRKYAISRFTNGKPLAGLKPIYGNTRRKWKDAQEEIIEHFAQLGMDVTEKKLVALTTVEKFLVKKYDKEKTEALLNQFVDRTKAPVILVPDSDHRPAIKSVSDHFQTHNEENTNE